MKIIRVAVLQRTDGATEGPIRHVVDVGNRGDRAGVEEFHVVRCRRGNRSGPVVPVGPVRVGPAGAVPKDGPSAGITMLTSILSALTQRPINAQYAMTGELNLRGEVMPIGGAKEKILAAKRNKIKSVILPAKNKKDLVGLEDIMKDIDVIWVEHADEVLNRVLIMKA